MKLFRSALFIGLGVCIGIIVNPLMSGDWAAFRYAAGIVGSPAVLCSVLLFITRKAV